jgi:hypothetical protein
MNGCVWWFLAATNIAGANLNVDTCLSKGKEATYSSLMRYSITWAWMYGLMRCHQNIPPTNAASMAGVKGGLYHLQLDFMRRRLVVNHLVRVRWDIRLGARSL